MRISDWSSDVCSSDLFAGMAERGWWGYLIEDVGQILEPLAQRGRPTVGETLELLIIRLDPGSHAEVSSEERRVGNECVGKSRSRWSRYHAKKKPSKHISNNDTAQSTTNHKK